jgi:hypothetical protein
MLFQQSEATAAQRRWFFVCVDVTDGVTPETGLTFSGAELQISENGAAFANFLGSATELSDGLYYYEATAAELSTLGALAFKVEKTGVRTTILQVGQVVPSDPYVATPEVNVTQWNASSVVALLPGIPIVDAHYWTGETIPTPTVTGVPKVEVTSIAAAAISFASFATDAMLSIFGILDSGTAQAGGSDTMTLRIGATSLNNAYADCVVLITSGTGALQVNQIQSYVGNSKVATMARAWSTNPAVDSTYIILAGSSSPGGVAEAVWDVVGEGAHTYGDLMRGMVSVLMGKVQDFGTGVLAFRNLADTVTRYTSTRSALGRIGAVINNLIS